MPAITMVVTTRLCSLLKHVFHALLSCGPASSLIVRYVLAAHQVRISVYRREHIKEINTVSTTCLYSQQLILHR